jgi:hypothetical protein
LLHRVIGGAMAPAGLPSSATGHLVLAISSSMRYTSPFTTPHEKDIAMSGLSTCNLVCGEAGPKAWYKMEPFASTPLTRLWRRQLRARTQVTLVLMDKTRGWWRDGRGKLQVWPVMFGPDTRVPRPKTIRNTSYPTKTTYATSRALMQQDGCSRKASWPRLPIDLYQLSNNLSCSCCRLDFACSI